MSWYVQVGPAAVGPEFDGLVDASEPGGFGGDIGAEAQEQIAAARAALKALAASGAVGTVRRVVGYVSGHANPGHEPAPGFARDGVTVSISQAQDDA